MDMKTYSLAMLVHIVQDGDMTRSQEALKEINRRGFDYEDLHEQFNG